MVPWAAPAAAASPQARALTCRPAAARKPRCLRRRQAAAAPVRSAGLPRRSQQHGACRCRWHHSAAAAHLAPQHRQAGGREGGRAGGGARRPTRQQRKVRDALHGAEQARRARRQPAACLALGVHRPGDDAQHPQVADALWGGGAGRGARSSGRQAGQAGRPASRVARCTRLAERCGPCGSAGGKAGRAHPGRPARRPGPEEGRRRWSSACTATCGAAGRGRGRLPDARLPGAGARLASSERAETGGGGAHQPMMGFATRPPAMAARPAGPSSSSSAGASTTGGALVAVLLARARTERGMARGPASAGAGGRAGERVANRHQKERRPLLGGRVGGRRQQALFCGAGQHALPRVSSSIELPAGRFQP
jgi:hypothetical protein